MQLIVLFVVILMTITASAADDLALPDPLRTSAGQNIATPEEWQKIRRPEILELFRTHVYGRTPAKTLKIAFDVFDEDANALDGKAIRKQIRVTAADGEKRVRIHLLMYLPKQAKQQAVPVMLLLNFGGNHTISSDPAIVLPEGYIGKKYSPPEKFRGTSASRYPVAAILARGYGIATAYCGDIDPDFHDGFKNGVHPLFDPPGQRPGDAWGTIGAWAWGLSRFMDYFETDKDVDHTRVVVLGHSRLGKTALWAGAQDERFSIVISNDSGCTGAALARRKKGENIAKINKSFPHWFCQNYYKFNDKEDDLPVDQHQLIALIAPVYVASASEDQWADPEAEFRSCVHAGPVYELFGLKDVGTNKFPEPQKPLHTGHIGYHLRSGMHDLTEYDWNCFMNFADKHWKKGQPTSAGDGKPAPKK
jgi:hypothetical protein